MIPLLRDRFGISSSGKFTRGNGERAPFVFLQAPFMRASRKVPISMKVSPVLVFTSSHAMISKTLGRPKTREIPPSLKSSAVDSDTQGKSSLSASAGPSCARPIKARSDEPPQTRIRETTAVKTPSGDRAKMTLSRRLIDSERNCLVSRSPKRVISGA